MRPSSEPAPTVGAMFAGYGGLELAVADVFPDARLAWVAEIEPAPARILAHHWPDVPNLGDVTAVDWAAVEPVDIITGGSPCFPAGTLIDTTDGYRPIETIRLGDLVRTHRERYMPVVQLMRREAADTVAVKIMGAPEFVTTVEHPFYVRTKGRGWNNTRRQYDRTWSAPEWVEAGSLTKDHFVGFTVTGALSHPAKLKARRSASTWRTGWRGSRGTPIAALHLSIGRRCRRLAPSRGAR